MGLMDANLLSQYLTGSVDGLVINENFLLGAAILMEIPIAMVLLSRLLPHRANRWTVALPESGYRKQMAKIISRHELYPTNKTRDFN